MVQRKVSNKLGIQAKSALKTKEHATTKPSHQNHDPKSKVADLKAIKMKKSRSIKRADIDFHSLRSPTSKTRDELVSNQPGEPPTTLVTPTKTQTPKKPSPCNKSSPCFSPNYMKSTSSSKARIDDSTKMVSVSTTSKIHKGAKTSSLKKVRTLTKAPSFKHSKKTGSQNKKVVLCENLDTQRATCSSTLKDSKFPSYLTLTPGATEAEGTSVMKVCPYHYCSLNGHRHAAVPPLKSFLSSRRRLLKTQKNVKPETTTLSPGKRKRSEVKVTEDDPEVGVVLSGVYAKPEDETNDFFVEIHVPKCDPAQVSESLSDGPCSESDFQEDVNLSDMNFSSDECPLSALQSQRSSGCYSDASEPEMDQLFGEISDMEWEEGQIPAIQDETVEFQDQKDYGADATEPGFEFETFLAEKLLPYIHDEIMECLLYSDAETLSDSESSQTDEQNIEDEADNDEASFTTEVEEESIEEHDSGLSNPIEEVTEACHEGLDCFEEPNESDADELREFTIEDMPSEGEYMTNVGEKEDIIMANNDSEAEVDQGEADNKEDVILGISDECQQPEEENVIAVEDVINSVTSEEQNEEEGNKKSGASSKTSGEEHDSDEVELHSFKTYAVEVKVLETEDIDQTQEEAALPVIQNKSQEVHKSISDPGNDSVDELLDSCNRLKRSARCKKADEDAEEDREFNPRPPNFLPVEPEPDAEKVDLRHQDMDERRNAEDWMLDHALQKTVNQLAPARKRKVALLVEAFESVLPVPNYEPRIRRNSSGFTHVRPIQACR